MSRHEQAFAVAFFVLVVLLLWTVIFARGPWQVKLALIVLVPTYSFALWQSLGSFEGWPTSQAPPQKNTLIASLVREPSRGDKGAVYLWLGQENSLEPRSYKLLYRRDLHEKVHRAQQRASQGARVGVKLGPGDRSPVRFYDLPPRGADTKDGT